MTEKIVNIIKEEPFVGEDDLDYIRVTKEILTPRKTYLKGIISGKYRGDKIPDESDKSVLFDFEIYEAEVICNSVDDFCKNKPFTFPHDFKNITNCNKIKGSIFPKEKLPQTLPVLISTDDKTFGINVLEPQLFEFKINRKEHQIEGDEVFGTFKAYLTGYVFDYEREEIEEIVEVESHTGDVIVKDSPLQNLCKSNGIKTGGFLEKKGYIKYEYFCKHHSDTVWGPWQKVTGSKDYIESKGCLSELLAIIGLVLFIAFLIAVLPGLLYLIGLLVILYLIGLLGPYFKWIFRALGLILLVLFIGSLFKTCNSKSHFDPIPFQDTNRESSTVVTPIVDSNSNNVVNPVDTDHNDSWIKRYRVWKDYNGKIYEGYYELKKSDWDKSAIYKNSLIISSNNYNAYDEVVYRIKEFDKNKLDRVYPLFDSIAKVNKLDKIKFAEMIVSFVQDIPYVLILDNDCNPNLYNDSFTRKYLSNPNSKCDGNQKFGINTPVEFLANLNGDCDTRTLLLYTIFSHYNYDVALLSSEYYGHSILGINLPLNGFAYTYDNQRYVLWETTEKNAKPGKISDGMSNINNWRISLKSK
ncbi:energy-coupling factor transporter transmembrane component T [Flavobacterium sp.]|uniref:energy-coupling factor transporter transmembrane component T n=1 Tax=Flavobacterium sp. TaxID=239 RepID=UPI0025DE9CC2|nr:energy-coupling factor transporter transmembrane component T [Flavobacterium sp.]